MKEDVKEQIGATQEEQAALVLLRSTGVPVLEAAQVACEALKVGRGKVKRTLRCLAEGAKTLKQQERTVCFAKAVEIALKVRAGKRARTVWDFRYFTRRFMKRCPGLARRRVRAMTPTECAEYIEQAFDTPRQRQKARLILSGVFGTAVKKGWCSKNPVAQVEVPRVVEKCIEVLRPQEIQRLMAAAHEYEGGRCLAAVGMMLYAGIRPHEVMRLRWEQVDLHGLTISILPQHSKTGGARLVTILRPLERVLRARPGSGHICPPQWLRHWRMLRRQAGFFTWVPDVLRHTFASYHLRYFRSYSELQYETGHRDSSLLRTRYVNMQAVGDAAAFWEC